MTIPTGFVKSTIHAPGAARRPVDLGELQDQRDGPQGLGEPTGAGGLLADHAEPRRQRLVDQSRGLPTDAELDEHEVGAVDRRLALTR